MLLSKYHIFTGSSGVRVSAAKSTRAGHLMIFLLLVTVFSFLPDNAVAETVDVRINMIRNSGVLISNVDDWYIGAYTDATMPRDARSAWDAVCVFTSSGVASLRLQSSNGPDLNLVGSSGAMIPYRIQVVYKRGKRKRRLLATTEFEVPNMSVSKLIDCGDARNQSNVEFRALVRRASFRPVPAGVYQDTVTLIVSPL